MRNDVTRNARKTLRIYADQILGTYMLGHMMAYVTAGKPFLEISLKCQNICHRCQQYTVISTCSVAKYLSTFVKRHDGDLKDHIVFDFWTSRQV